MAVALSPDAIELAYDVAGDGDPTVVLIHGWSCDRHHWRNQVPHLARSRRVVSIDLAGHGDSGAGRSAWTMEAFGADVVAVVDALGVQSMILVGHSMGGDVATVAAAHLGARVRGVVWIDTYPHLEGPSDPAATERFLATFRDDFMSATRAFVHRVVGPTSDPDVVEWIAADMASAPTDIALDALARAVTFSPTVVTLLSELQVPVVAINRDDGQTDIESLGRHGVEVAVAPGAGHFPHLETPVAFNTLLDDVLARLTTETD